jgi:hypothetical protein
VGFVVAFLLPGCTSANGTNPAETSDGAATASFVEPLAMTQIAGKYVGSTTVKSSKTTGKLVIQLASASGSVGGWYLETFKTVKLTGVLALSGTPAAFTGTAIEPSSFRPCSFAVTASYNSSTHVLSGASKEISGQCGSSQSTFTAQKQCYYVVASAIDRPNGALKPC